MKRSLIHWGIDSAAFCVAAFAALGFHAPSHTLLFFLAGGLFASFSAIARPFFWLLVCPLNILTLAPLVLGLNALLIWLSVSMAGRLCGAASVGGLGPLVIGAMIVSAVRAFLMMCANAYRSQRAFEEKRADLLRLEETKRRLDRQLGGWKALAEEWGNTLKQS